MRPVQDVATLKPYRAVLGGSAIHGAKGLPDATEFVKRHGTELEQLPLISFLVCATFREDNAAHQREVLAYLDLVRVILEPLEIGLFAGSLDASRLPFLERMLVKAMKSEEGDWHDWAGGVWEHLEREESWRERRALGRGWWSWGASHASHFAEHFSIQEEEFMTMAMVTCCLAPTVALGPGAVQARSEEVSLSVPGAELHATLTIPDGVGVSCPPVLLILAGSGPTDRDGNSPLGVHSNVYRKLASALEGAGYAALRPDKRLIGESTVSDPREDVLTFDTYIQDAEAWLRWLGERTDLAQVGIIGHSEGALIGLGAALGTPVSAYVCLAGAGENITSLITRQLHANTATPVLLLQEAERIMVSLRAGQTVAAVSPELMGLFRPSVQPYMISWMRLDPPAMLSRLNVPALIVQGDRDVQVYGAGRPEPGSGPAEGPAERHRGHEPHFGGRARRAA
ncbi:alpha/beta fold hydrolase [Deinococcus alpinitundrae]|uniref:alpha/beta fold hydrolase n=1 Tax=Deinococcus alpinitundrae TaxID=468913 RepID=UPI001ED97476|nr:alpha/beta fold hydrolase [Deinococcus alpinitundrae]